MISRRHGEEIVLRREIHIKMLHVDNYPNRVRIYDFRS